MKQEFEKNFRRAEAGTNNLLLMLAFTAINLILLALNSDYFFLFSATVPYYALAFGLYGELTVGYVLAAVIMGLYLLCWLGSKRHPGWLVAAFVLMILDTLCLMGLSLVREDVSGLVDFAFHVWMLVYLFLGFRSGFWLRKNSLPEDRQVEVLPDTPWLRRADMEEKHRVLLQTAHEGRSIVYRRVKKCNQLIIDGYVYNEVSMVLETRHILSAQLDGHIYEVGYDGRYSFCAVDGTTVERKLRFF